MDSADKTPHEREIGPFMALFSTHAVRGVVLPRRRFTVWGALYFFAYVGVPVLGLAFLLDLLIYVAFDQLLDRCYGVLCLLS